MPRRKSKTLVKRKKSPKNKRKNKTMKLRRKRSRKYRRKQKGGEQGMVSSFVSGSGNPGNAPDAQRRAQIARERKAHEAKYGKPKQEGYTMNDAADDSCSIM